MRKITAALLFLLMLTLQPVSAQVCYPDQPCDEPCQWSTVGFWAAQVDYGTYYCNYSGAILENCDGVRRYPVFEITCTNYSG